MLSNIVNNQSIYIDITYAYTYVKRTYVIYVIVTSILEWACRDAQDNGEYAKAFWLCAECCRTMETVASLKVAQQLNATINQLYEDTISRLEGALQAVCNDFRSEQYMKVCLSAVLVMASFMLCMHKTQCC